MKLINHGCAECSDNVIFRIFLYHFYTSVTICDSNDRFRLKKGAAPTMYLSQKEAENDMFKETINLPRILGLLEDS